MSVALANAQGDVHLRGTLGASADHGIATFSDLTIDQRETLLDLVRTFAYLDDAKPDDVQ